MADEGWYIINLDKRQYFKIYIEHSRWMDAIGTLSPLFELLAAPLPPQDIADGLVTREYTLRQGGKVGLLHLPNEVLHELFGKLDRVEDAICFSLVSKLFATLGKKYVHALLTRCAAAWRGDRVTRLRLDAPLMREIEDNEERKILWPAGVFTDSEKKEIQQYHAESTGAVRYMHTFVEKNFEEVGALHRAFVDVEKARNMQPKEAEMYMDWGFPKYNNGLGAGGKGESKADSDLVLRNLSRRQYVRGSDLKTLSREMNLPAYAIDFAGVLLKRTYWRGGDAQPIVALWAGDRFDITTMGPDIDGWTDVFAELSTEYKGGQLSPKRELERQAVQ